MVGLLRRHRPDRLSVLGVSRLSRFVDAAVLRAATPYVRVGRCAPAGPDRRYE
ncbi:MAG: hypothetical protein ACRDRU_01875 [Pseudonocardiaceae bacterium]